MNIENESVYIVFDPMAIRRCVKSTDMAIVLWHFMNDSLKHKNFKSEAHEAGYRLAMSEVDNMLYEKGIIINDLIE